MENEEVFQETENLEGDSNTETVENELEVQNEPEDIEVLKEKLSKSEEIAHNQKIRAEKAEKALKAQKQTPKEEAATPKNEGLNLKDIRALQDVPDEDVDEVMNYAKYKGVAISEAKADPVIKILLKTKAEERKTAEATATNGGRKYSKSSETDLLKKAESGQLSDNEMAEAAKAVIASFIQK